MSLQTAAVLARREFRSGLRGWWIFLACLTFGTAAIAAIGTIRASIEAGLLREGAVLLGGDVQLEFSYRFANEREQAWMAANAHAVSEIASFRSMVTVDSSNDTDSALTQVKSVDDAYPLRGNVALAPAQSLQKALIGDGTIPGAVMDPVLIERMDLRIGDRFWLGGQTFVLTATLVNEPDNATGGFGLGPRTIVSTAALDASGLLTPGTLFSTRYRMILADGMTIPEIARQARTTFDGTGMQWTDARNGAPATAEFVERLGIFLVLMGLSGLVVGGVGIAAAVNTFITEKTSVIATLKALGANHITIFQIYCLQIGLLSLAGVLIGLVLGGIVPLVAGELIERRLPVPTVFTIHLQPLFEAALYGLLITLIFTMWPLSKTRDIRTAVLFRDADTRSRSLPPRAYIVSIAVLIVILVGLIGFLHDILILAFWTAVGLSTSLIILALVAYALRGIARKSGRVARTVPSLRWALNSIGNAQESTIPVMVALGLGLSVLASIGQIDGNLRHAISNDLPAQAPAYFLIDIQRDQLEHLKDDLNSKPFVSRIQTAPMLRGVISHINDIPAQEFAGDHWVLEGDRGITYSETPPENTKLVSGTWWDSDYDGQPQVSFAAQEAEEMGLSLGDILTINILGRDVTATLTSLREVDFSTAGIGFIMSMNPTALAHAPHSFIATIYADNDTDAQILRGVTNNYPNITAIPVREAIAQFRQLLERIANATFYGASATVFSGFLVLIGATAAGIRDRRYEAAILKTLGATRRRIFWNFALRSTILGATAGSVAFVVGVSSAWALNYFVLDTDYQVIWSSAISILVGGVLLSLCTGMAFAWHPLATRPANILRARD